MEHPLNRRISQILEALNETQSAFAKNLDVNRSRVSNVLTGRNKPDSEFLSRIVTSYPEINAAWLLTGEGEMLNRPFYPEHLGSKHPEKTQVFEHTAPYYEKGEVKGEVKGELFAPDKKKLLQNWLPQVVTVEPAGSANIVEVPVPAQAGYLVGYADREYIEQLPAFNLPGFRNGTFRAFEVAGYSMLITEGMGLYPSDRVIGQFVEKATQIVDNRVYVVVSEEGVLIKRAINRLQSASKLILNSDNQNGEYPPIILESSQIKEVWEFKAKISRHIPRPIRLLETITDLEARITLLGEEVNRLKDQKTPL